MITIQAIDVPDIETQALKDRLRAFIGTNFYVPDPTHLADDAPLVDGGIIDSTGALELICFLEDEFQISVGDDDVVPDNLNSIGQLARFIQSKSTS